MPGMCSVPGCKGYKKARSRGVVFHSLPTRDPGRCRKWLRAIHNPTFDENTPVSKYGNIRVCSQHFKPEDYEPDLQAVLMKTPPRKILKCNVIPSVFSGRQQKDLRISLSADDRNQSEQSHIYIHISDPVEEIQANLMRREQGFLSSWSRCEQCQTGDVEHQTETAQRISEEDCLRDSYEEMEVTMDEDECNNMKNRLFDSDSDIENVPETTKLNSQGAGDSSDEDVYVPITPQRSTTSHLVLECEEEELEPWQKQTSNVQLKDEDDVGNDQTDSSSSLQTNAGFIVVSAQLPCNTELIGSLRTQCCSGNSSTVIQAAQHELFQKEPMATIKTETDDIVHTSEEHLISNNPVSLSSVYAASSAQLQSDQSNSQTLPVPIPLPCFTVLKLKLTGTSINSFVYQEDTL